MRRREFLPALLIGLSGCTLVAPAPASPEKYFVLQPPPSGAGAQPVRSGGPSLLVSGTTAGTFVGSRRLVYAPDQGTRSYYQFAYWTDPPQRQLNDLMLDRLERSGLYRSVVRADSGATGSLQLNTELVEFYHAAWNEPGEAVVVLDAQLVDRARRTALAKRTFRVVVPLKTFDAEGAVSGFNVAVGRVLEELLGWLGTTSSGA